MELCRWLSEEEEFTEPQLLNDLQGIRHRPCIELLGACSDEAAHLSWHTQHTFHHVDTDVARLTETTGTSNLGVPRTKIIYLQLTTVHIYLMHSVASKVYLAASITGFGLFYIREHTSFKEVAALVEISPYPTHGCLN